MSINERDREDTKTKAVEKLKNKQTNHLLAVLITLNERERSSSSIKHIQVFFFLLFIFAEQSLCMNTQLIFSCFLRPSLFPPLTRLIHFFFSLCFSSPVPPHAEVTGYSGDWFSGSRNAAVRCVTGGNPAPTITWIRYRRTRLPHCLVLG